MAILRYCQNKLLIVQCSTVSSVYLEFLFSRMEQAERFGIFTSTICKFALTTNLTVVILHKEQAFLV